MRRTTYALFTAALLLPALGCEYWTGGGWIYSAGDPAAKATMGFEVTCEKTAPDEVMVSVLFEYNDHGFTVAGPNGKDKTLAFHSEQNSFIFGDEDISCAVLDAAFIEEFGQDGFFAFYEPQPAKMGEGGIAIITLADGGTQGAPPKGDTISIEIIDGVFEGYSNSGELHGGQITLHLD